MADEKWRVNAWKWRKKEELRNAKADLKEDMRIRKEEAKIPNGGLWKESCICGADFVADTEELLDMMTSKHYQECEWIRNNWAAVDDG